MSSNDVVSSAGTDSEKENLDRILIGLQQRHGVDFSLYRRSTVERRLARRMALTLSRSYGEYLCCLEQNPGEYDLLLRDLTIKVSRFFRNRPLFDLIETEILPEIIAEKERRNENTLRLWCAGCSYGEEAYSIAITLLECLRRRNKPPADYRLSLFATDIDEEALNRAKAGEYTVDALKETVQEIVDRYFVRIPTHTAGTVPSRRAVPVRARFRVADRVREMVCFCTHDLTSQTRMSPPAGLVASYDLILCRNLLIYFSKPLQERAFSNLVHALNPGGYLVLGKSESIPDYLKETLVPKQASAKAYRKEVR